MAVFLYLGLYVIPILLLDLRLKYLPYPFHRVQVEDDVLLAPQFPLLADYSPSAQGSIQGHFNLRVVYVPELKPAGAGVCFPSVIIVNELIFSFLDAQLEPPRSLVVAANNWGGKW